jgi:fatty acid desaturase
VKGWWERYEGPTWLVAFAIYAGWLALAALHRHIAPLLAVALGAYLTAWHSSFQHETIHAMRRVPRRVRTLLAFPPLGVWFPYDVYRREHVQHHGVRELTGPLDPESFYFEPAAWSALPVALRVLYGANQTLAGRLTLGPALLIGRAYAAEIRRLRAGDRSRLRAWLTHLAATAGLLALLQTLAGIAPLTYLACVAYPAASLGLIRSFAEHRAAENAADRTATVVSRSLLSLLFLNNNYHATHHAFPALPWYAIPARWRAGVADGQPERLVYAGGYRQIVRSWLWRAIDSPVRAAAAARPALVAPRRSAAERTGAAYVVRRLR